MMISPDYYIEQLKEADYLQLIEERNGLIEAIEDFEKNELTGDRSGEARLMMPSPEVVYQMNLEYLGRLCEFMKEKYNRDYVWENKRLKKDI